jgi:hypothetical protein
MANFRQKTFSEYDAMKSLFVELTKRCNGDRRKMPPVINNSALVSVLRGNNIVIEKFVISTSAFGKDKYRMYLKIGAKCKMPNDVRLPSKVYDKGLGSIKLTFNGGIFGAKQKENSAKNEEGRLKLFGNNKSGGGKGPKPVISGEISPYIDIKKTVQELSGEVVKYDKVDRSLVLEFNNIGDAINSLAILPFGIDYKIYLLNA